MYDQSLNQNCFILLQCQFLNVQMFFRNISVEERSLIKAILEIFLGFVIIKTLAACLSSCFLQVRNTICTAKTIYINDENNHSLASVFSQNFKTGKEIFEKCLRWLGCCCCCCMVLFKCVLRCFLAETFQV